MADLSTFTDLSGTTYNLKDAEARSLLEIKVIESGTDLNTIKTRGLYLCPSNAAAASLVNCPSQRAFIMEVLPNTTSYFHQRITRYSSSTVNDWRVWARNQNGANSWTPWKRQTDSPYYAPGDTFENNEMVVYPGYDALANNIGFSVVVPKLLTEVSSIAIDTLKLRFCGPSGYISGYSTTQDVMTSGYTVTARKRGENLIHFNVTHTNLSSIARGTCINVVVENIKLTFS